MAEDKKTDAEVVGEFIGKALATLTGTAIRWTFMFWLMLHMFGVPTHVHWFGH